MSGHKFKGNIRVEGNVALPNETANRALILDGSNEIAPSTVTSTELEHVSGVTSPIQTQLNDLGTEITDVATDVADLVTLSGVAANSEDLGSFSGTIISDNETIKGALQELETFVEALPDPIVYKGTWNATTNSPALSNTDTGVAGFLYYVAVAGTQDFGAGNISFEVGDKVVNNGTTWDKWDMTDAVASVNGQTGVVVLDTSDIAEDTNLYFTDERAQDAVGGMVDDSAKISLTYNDGTPSLIADIIADSLVDADINSAAAIARTKLANGSANHVVINDGSGVMSSEAQLGVSRGGTGVDASTVTDGQILIGHDANNNFSLATLTQGSGITITNGAGSITIAANATGNPNDIPETSFSAANDQATPQDITGFLLDPADIRSFVAQVSISVDATTPLDEVYEIQGIQKAAGFEIAQMSVGDDSGILFSIVPATGQMQYTSADFAGFVSATIKFRVTATAV